MNLRVLCTGGAGFVGSHLVDRLCDEGHSVTVLDDFSSGSRKNLNIAAELIVGDVSVQKTWRNLEEHDFIFGLACFPRSASLQNPYRDLQVNYLATIHALEYAKPKRTPIVFASNTGIVSHPRKLPIDEKYPDMPSTPYDLHKLGSEHLLRIYSEQFNVPTLVLRFASVYGPRQSCHEEINWHPIIPHFLKLIKAHEPPTIDGDGEQTRDFIYISDIVDGLISGMNALLKGRAPSSKVILGTNTETSINDLWKEMATITKSKLHPKHGPPRPADIRRMRYDSRLAQRELGWKAKVDLKEGLQLTVTSRGAQRPTNIRN
jgi:UDP-glucose 4-epimerase